MPGTGLGTRLTMVRKWAWSLLSCRAQWSTRKEEEDQIILGHQSQTITAAIWGNRTKQVGVVRS